MYIQDKSNRPQILSSGYLQQAGYPSSTQRTGVVITWQGNGVWIRVKAAILNKLCSPFVTFKVQKLHKGLIGSDMASSGG